MSSEPTIQTQKENVVSLTKEAIAEVKHLLDQEENKGKVLRVYVESGGCSGMQYGLVFDERRAGDFEGEFNGVSVLVDEFSAQHVRGAVVHFSDALTGGGFKITNPNARQTCGCGNSFQS